MRRRWLGSMLWVLVPSAALLPGMGAAAATEMAEERPADVTERPASPAGPTVASTLPATEPPHAVAQAMGTHPHPRAPAEAPGAPTPPASETKPGLNVGASAPSLADERAEAAERDMQRPVFQIRARVIARATADERRDFDRRFGLPTGELSATASHSLLEAELSADFADRQILKDAYVRISTPSRDLRLYGGQFKSPFLARRLMGRWALPSIQRGLVNDFLIEDHGLGGRRLGLMGEWRAKPLWNLRASIGVFEGGVDELGLRTGREDASARVAIRPIRPLTLGASGYLVSAFEGAHRAGSGALDATWRKDGLRLMGEVVAGQIRLGDFTAQSLLAAWALPLDGAQRWELEPVLGAESLQLHGPQGGTGYAYSAGVNLIFLDAFKAMVQGEHALRPGDTRPAFSLFFQLAAQLSVE